MPSAQLTIFPGCFQRIVTQAITTIPMHMGIVVPANAITPVDVEVNFPIDFINVEYSQGGWLRPVSTIFSPGSFNYTTSRWEIPPSTNFSVTAPSGGLEIKQAFVLIGSTNAPLNATGDMIGVATYPNPISLGPLETKLINFKLELFNAA
jgi:hypothetical protein